MSVKICFEIGHEASRIKTPHPNNFTHNWELFVRGIDGNDISHYVDKVVFSLHDSFPRPKRVLKDPPYVVKEAGYAAFEMPVTIYFKNKNEDPKKLEFKYDLDLLPVKVQREEYVFHNPSEDFKRKLIKGGGISLNKEPSSGKSSTSNSSEVKKHKHKEESKVTNTFATLFGPPITKSSTKVSPDPKSQQNKVSPNYVKPPVQQSSKSEKSEKTSSSSTSSREKSEKSEKHKSKHHSPSRERTSENKDRKERDDKHEKKKDKSHSKERSSKDKSQKRPRSPSPKRQPSPVPKSKPVEPSSTDNKSSVSSSKKSSKKDKKGSDREKKESKSKETDKKSEHKSSSSKDKEPTSITSASKEVLKEKSKHDSNKIEQSNPATPVNEKKTDKAESDRKHKHKKKEKSKDHDREKDTKEKKSSSKSSSKPIKEESNHAPSPVKQPKRPESRKHENIVPQPPLPVTKPAPRTSDHDTSDSDEDSHAGSSKIDSGSSTREPSIKREISPSPPPPPPPPVIVENQKSRKTQEKTIKEEKKRKKRTKEESDHSPSPLHMEPPIQKRKDEIKNGDTGINRSNTPNNQPHESASSKSTSFISPGTDRNLSNDYMSELKDLQHKIMNLQDNNDLQQVVEMIAATGQYEITSKTFDFDLCALDPGLIKRLQEFFSAPSCS